ncbi:conjugative transfer signal peptidase TraF [Agrobacterium tumefaciens]|uniref:conjugative transfer signal peptidase TraF n=1 Tax=Agrobacterium tumefaciens TaxID=358 RepID=UPI001573473B|nr:conjugative transfer signal peptidase TraF [Agrobacterium tumefaciens]MCZ7497261.1 conjugative transfer signal peptidase TraF [Rhizobium rhizogenes]NTE56478.1 conjugative transfer signal peptidase TraF [Agrobacterium tumefaciens]NTE74446.1 conjugative transfer signal peptidase TraF [Agrobacterium tumefaciens]
MTHVPLTHGSITRQRWKVVATVASGLIACVAIFAAGAIAGFRINLTPSEPLGLWRIQPLERAVAVGDLVFVCLPATGVFAEARARGYLRGGTCPTGAAPLIKMVIAVEGQRVDIGAEVHVDGLRIPQTSVVRADGRGRLLHSGRSGIVPPGNIFLYSPFSASWDSRYFGAVPASGILGLAVEVLTYAP